MVSEVTVAIWPVAVSAAQFATLYTILSAEERQRAAKMRAETGKEFIVCRSVMRNLLAQQLGCRPTDIEFGVESAGKPRIIHPQSDVAFNVAHSGGMCALAIGRARNLGVDIELCRPGFNEILESAFSPDEAAEFGRLHHEAQNQAFFRAWVVKEAYLKATGEGLAGDLKSLGVIWPTGSSVQPVSVRGSAAAIAHWRIYSFDVTENIVGAVAIERNGTPQEKIEVRHIAATDKLVHIFGTTQ